MSRHKVPLRDGIAAASAYVGWDRPLQTYFAQVLSAPDEDGEEIEQDFEPRTIQTLSLIHI